jgi:hypothetical protein
MDYFGHETKPSHFLIPIPIFIIGGLFMSIPGQWDIWDWIGGLIMFSGVALIWFLGYTAIKDKRLAEIREHYYHDAEITKLDASKTKTKVVIDKTSLTGYMAQSFNELNIPPGKLKKFAHGVIVDGLPMTIREWTPIKKGKLFSDPQWRTLIAFMKQPDWEDRHIKFVVPINPNNLNDSFELTKAGEQWLTGVLEQADSILTPVSA